MSALATASGVAAHRLLLCGAAIFAVLFGVFFFSPHVVVTDSRYSLLVSEALLTKGTLKLDGLVPLPDYRLYQAGGHVRLFFPEASSLLAVPFMGLVRPFGGSVFDEEGRFEEAREDDLQKILAALLCAAAGVVLWRLAAQFTGEGAALVIALAACLASPIWGSASRAMWADTWGLLLLCLALLMAVKPLRWPGLVVLGTCLSWMYFVKPTYSVPIAAITVVLLWRKGWRAWSLLLTGAVWLGGFLLWSWHSHGTLQPVYFLASRLRESNVVLSLPTHIFSPSRGLLVYFPAAAWAVWMVMRNWARVKDRDWVVASFVVFVVHYIVHAAHSATGGHCYGARFGVPLVPWFVLLAAIGWEVPPAKSGRLLALGCGFLLVLWGAAVNGRGALDPNTWSWNFVPVSIDDSPERVWDWGRPQFMVGLLPDRLILPDRPPALPEKIDFRSPDSGPFLLGNWCGLEGEGRWSMGANAAVVFSAVPGRGFRVKMPARTFGPQRVVSLLNGETVWKVRTDGGDWFTGEFELPGKYVKDRNLLEFRFPDRRVPHRTMNDGDFRELGLMVAGMEFRPDE